MSMAGFTGGLDRSPAMATDRATRTAVSTMAFTVMFLSCRGLVHWAIEVYAERMAFSVTLVSHEVQRKRGAASQLLMRLGGVPCPHPTWTKRAESFFLFSRE